MPHYSTPQGKLCIATACKYCIGVIILCAVVRELLITSRDGSMPQFLSGVHVTYRTPIVALLFEVRINKLFCL